MGKKEEKMKDGDKDWDTKCMVCEQVPTVHPTGLCGPCYQAIEAYEKYLPDIVELEIEIETELLGTPLSKERITSVSKILAKAIAKRIGKEPL